MSEFIEAWRRATDNWLIVEYERRPNALCCNVTPKDSELFFAFGSLGASREKLESADDQILSVLLAYVAQGALDEGWNVSTSSLWTHFLYYTPYIEDYIEYDDATLEEAELLGRIWVFLTNE
jgi:hypothetical protein